MPMDGFEIAASAAESTPEVQGLGGHPSAWRRARSRRRETALWLDQGSIKEIGVVCAAFEFEFMAGRWVRWSRRSWRVRVAMSRSGFHLVAARRPRMQGAAVLGRWPDHGAVAELPNADCPSFSVLTDATWERFGELRDDRRYVIAEPKR